MSAISSEQVKQLLDADLANIIRKVRQGKPLTTSERQMFLTLHGEEQTTAASKTELAKALGISRQSLYKWMQKEDAPTEKEDGSFDMGEWFDFAKRHGLKDFQEQNSTTLSERKLYFQTLILKAKYETLMGELIPVATVEKLITDKAIEIRKVILNSALNDDEKDKILGELYELRNADLRPKQDPFDADQEQL